MQPPLENANRALTQLILVRPEPAGQFTACVVGLPELRATAATRAEAVQQAGAQLEQWLTSGQLQTITVAASPSPLKWFGHTNPNDPDEQAYLEELARLREEDLEQTLREDERE